MLSKEIRKGESDTLEFKRTLPPMDRKVLKTIVAFANGEGGKIIFGIDDKTREIVGVDREQRARLQDSITDMISNNCSPQIFPIYTWVEMEGKSLFVVEIPISHNCPYYMTSEGVNKGTYVRVDATTRVAEPEKVRELQLYGAHLTYDEIVEHGVQPASEEEIRSLCESMQEYLGTARKPISVKQLVGWGLLEQRAQEYYPSIAFRLLTRADLRFSGIQCARFDGTKRVHFIDRKFFDGPVYEQLENAQRFLLQYLKLGAEIKSLRRKDLHELPVAALREVLANAVIHRNYLVHGHIQVSVFDDRVEISSPGSLYAHLTKQQMLNGDSRLRNPLLAGIFMRMGIIEQWGTGIQRVYDICAAAHVPGPTYAVVGDTVVATFLRPVKEPLPEQADAKQPDSRQNKRAKDEAALLSYLKSNNKATRTQISQELDITPERVLYLVRKLTASGQLKRDGGRKLGVWIISE